jgi:uncharacterized protein YciI
MAKRVKTEDSDSCELMLDTICNVFGGMILMAVLVVIQTQATVARLPQAEKEAAEASLDIRDIKFRINRQEKHLAVLKQQEANLNKKYSGRVSPHTDTILSRRLAFSKAIQDAKRRIAGGTKRRQADQDDLKDVHAQQGRAEETLEERRDQIASVRKEHMRLDQLSRKKIRLPQTRQSRGLTQAAFIIRGRHVYPCGDSDYRLKQLANGTREIIPIEGRRLLVDKNDKVEGFDAALSVYNRRTHFIILFVSRNNDSFESFQTVRKKVVAKGFECGYVAQNRVYLVRDGYDKVE